MIDQDAMAIAADALGYPVWLILIEREPAFPLQVSQNTFIRCSSKDRGRSPPWSCWQPARHSITSNRTDGTEKRRRRLAVAALDLTGDRRLFDHAAETARRIIQANVNATSYRAKKGYNKRNSLGLEPLVSDRDGRRGPRRP